MEKSNILQRSFVLLALVACACTVSTAADDPRNILNGSTIPDEGYCDQPYVVVTKDGNWLCVLTTGPGVEGGKGQHVVSTISTDQGKTWSAPVNIEASEPTTNRESSWAIPFVTPSGRVYAFYNYNGENIGTLPNGAPIAQPDVIGWYVFKYSDDNGQSWSPLRYRILVPVTAADRGNDWGGAVQIFWGIDKPKVVINSVMFAYTKLGRFMFENGEGWIFNSDNVLTENDPTKINWTTLPDGDNGIRAPQFGSVQEEHNMVPLSDGKLYMVYRTTNGRPCQTYSSDGGHTWTTPEYMTYTPDGQQLKNPRACPRLFKTSDGHYLFWYENNGNQDYLAPHRNPAWICGGVEKDGRIYWSQPEILLYDPDSNVGFSYPDLIEQNGRFWITETNKSVARVHEIDPALLEGLWRQDVAKTIARRGLLLEWSADKSDHQKIVVPKVVDLRNSGGLSLDCWIRLDDLAAGQTILDGRDAGGKGIALTTTRDGSIRLMLSDGKTTAAWDCDPGSLRAGTLHHVVAIADAGPRIITFVVDGVLCDGGQSRVQGWGRWQGTLEMVLDRGALNVGPALKSLRIYGRYLRTSEAIGNFRAGPK